MDEKETRTARSNQEKNDAAAEAIREIVEDERIPVWGIAPASRMADEPPGHRLGDFLPGVRSLVCFGVPVPRGVYRTPVNTEETIWRTQNILYRRLDTIAFRIAELLEETGDSAVPTYGCMPLGMNEKRVVVGYLNQIRMGEAAGIGVIGRNGLLLHSRYGSRLMLGAVLTTAVLPERRPADTEEPGCPPDCRICADVCPVGAIMAGDKKVDIMRCLSYTARTASMSRLKFVFLSAFNPRAAARYMSLTSFDEHTFHRCSRCVSLCPYGNRE